MRKKAVVVVFAIMMAMCMTGCNLIGMVSAANVYNQEQDSATYEEIHIEGAKFEVPSIEIDGDNVDIAVNTDSGSFAMQEEGNYLFYAQSVDNSVYDKDIATMASNIENACGLSGLDVDDSNYVTGLVQGIDKAIFDCSYEKDGETLLGKAACVTDGNNTDVLIILNNGYYDDSQITYMAKSLKYCSCSDFYEAPAEVNTSEEFSEEPTENPAGEGETQESYTGATQVIGDDTVGYMMVPDFYVKFADAGGSSDTMVQYSDPAGIDVFTLEVYDKETYGEALDIADSLLDNIVLEQGEENVNSAMVDIAGYDAYQIYTYYESEDKFLIIWVFDGTNDGYIHYLAIELLSKDIDAWLLNQTYSLTPISESNAGGATVGSTDWTSMQISVDGTVFQLPSAVFRNMTDAGWNMVDSISDFSQDLTKIDPNTQMFGDLDLSKESYTGEFSVEIQNASSSVKSYEECNVWSVSVDNTDIFEQTQKPIPFELPGGIHDGSSKEEIIAAYGNCDDIYESEYGYCQYNYSKDGCNLSLSIYDDYGLLEVDMTTYN